MKALLITLSVIEEGEKGSELVRNQRWAEIVFQDLKHFKTLPEILSVSILKEVADGAILQGRAKLAFPELAGKGVARVSHQERIIASRGETGRPEPEEDEIPQLQIVLARLNGRQSKFVHRKWDRRKGNVI